MKHFRILPFALALAATPLLAQTDAGNNDTANDAQNDSKENPKAADYKPIAKWTFDAKEAGKWKGKEQLEDGPLPPTFPAFQAGNKAAYFGGANTAIVVKESDLPDTNVRFGMGDAITLEAWVNVEEIRNGSYCYLIGKGRNKNKEFTAENQNYALRLKGEGGEARPTFLFRSLPDKPGEKEGYHRWVTTEGFTPGSGWHHVAVTYTFGKGASIRGFIDGKEVKGTWDLDGKSDRAPVQDGDDIMIGTGYGGGEGNTLRGWLDEIAIYRKAVPETLLSQRYQFIPPPPVVNPDTLPKGLVRVEICESGVPAKNAWPTIPPKADEAYNIEAFGISDIPQKYVDTGVRGDRANPLVLRAAAKVTLPEGKHRLLLRGRSASQLYIDGKLVMKLAFAKPDSGGHGYVSEQATYLDLGPGFRFAPPGTQESVIEFEFKGGEHVVMLEQMVGGVLGAKNRRRPETGEMVVAWSKQGTETWELLSPGKEPLAYNDRTWTDYEAKQNTTLAAMNAEARESLRRGQAGYWVKRHEAATKWLAETPEVKVPEAAEGYPTLNAIDNFISQKIQRVAAQNTAAQSGTVDYYRDIQPILETKCYDCHQGTKTKGDLRLDDFAAAMRGGESDGAGITPKHPEKSSIIARVSTDDEELIMPPKGKPLTKEQIELLNRWIKEGANWPELKVAHINLTPLTDDLAFLRRVTLDTVGVAPSLAEIETFTKDTSKDKRAKAIERLLADPRWADNWVGYWQDVLAENPNILNPTLNNTGPFRWWIYESMLDDKPMDLFVTELVRMRGSVRFGGPAGFGVASQNDVPMAAKGTIVTTAFLGVETKCARCHDSPAHESTQQDLFELAAMLATQPLDVPTTSSVPMDKLHAGGRKPLIQVTLQPGTKVQPKWPFPEFCPEDVADKLAQDAKDDRDRLASLITAPQNERFAQVITNRLWARLMGRGIVEPVADWEKGKPTHPELLKYLGREFVRSGYSLKKLAALIMNSHAYQRATDSTLKAPSPLFTSPAPRRLNAEQIVDSLFAATGKPFRTEEVSLDIDGRRDLNNSISMGNPRRSWMLASTSNERDRPSLSLPRIQAVGDVLTAFGWRGARQDPSSVRETDPNALQPAIISNGTVGVWLTRLSDDHGVTQLALQDQPVDKLIDTLFLKLLTRKPTAEERERYTSYLSEGYASRVKTDAPARVAEVSRKPAKYVSWSNHLDPEATTVRMQEEVDARKGDPPTDKLDAAWRQKLEDVLWAMLNAPEWVYAP
jgi:hypothetical protein